MSITFVRNYHSNMPIFKFYYRFSFLHSDIKYRETTNFFVKKLLFFIFWQYVEFLYNEFLKLVILQNFSTLPEIIYFVSHLSDAGITPIRLQFFISDDKLVGLPFPKVASLLAVLFSFFFLVIIERTFMK